MEASGLAAETTRRASVGVDGRARSILRRACAGSAALVSVALVALALGAAVGRWQVLPAGAVGDDVAVEAGDLVFVVPVASLSLHDGDTVYVQYERGDGALRRVSGVVDSWERRFEIRGVEGGNAEVAQLPPTVWRVSRRVPMLGLAFRFLVGPMQSIVVMFAGLVLIACSEVRRNRAQRVGAPQVDRHVNPVLNRPPNGTDPKRCCATGPA